MFSRRACFFLATLVMLFAVAGCGGKTEEKAPVKASDAYFDVKIGARTVKVQIAALPPEQERGLMFRKEMGRDEGMLFVFTASQRMAFWMRNTTLPLDIGYLDAQGVLREIYPMYPLDERSVASRSMELQFALEMNQGWFKANGVKPGDQLDLKAVAEALRARGLRPEAAGLK